VRSSVVRAMNERACDEMMNFLEFNERYLRTDIRRRCYLLQPTVKSLSRFF
jgi:hypothetical protein